ncbi:hypothetical protein TNCV_134911 [Trichonephila clavipes]|nr:hypothetical protein TNCV_134911 [Trichonephila clavipes]
MDHKNNLTDDSGIQKSNPEVPVHITSDIPSQSANVTSSTSIDSKSDPSQICDNNPSDEDHERDAAQRYPTHVQSVTYPANTQAKEEAVPAANQDRI